MYEYATSDAGVSSLHNSLGYRLPCLGLNDCEATIKRFVQDLWNNPFFWISFSVVIVIRLLFN